MPHYQHGAFQHTHISLYLVFSCAFVVVSYDSAQGLSSRYELTKKWWLTYAGVLCAAYLYLRPLIRRRLGSAQSGYVNYYSLHIIWLCSSVFLHLPGLAELGLDVRADMSILLTTFLVSLAALAVAHGLHSLAVTFHVIAPALQNPSAGRREVLSIALLNAITIAVACSSFYSFCGNAAQQASSGGPAVREAICGHWLQPMDSEHHPRFSRWVLFGGSDGQTLPLSGEPLLDKVGSRQVISPVYTLWITLMTMFLTNCLADYGAVQAIEGAAQEAKAQMQSTTPRGSRGGRASHTGAAAADGLGHRRHSFDVWRTRPAGSHEELQRRVSSTFGSVAPFMRRAATAVAIPELAFERAASAILPDQAMAMLHSMGSFAHWADIKTRKKDDVVLPSKEDDYNGHGQYGPGSNRLDAEEGLAGSSLDGMDDVDSARPDFLPMFPWYSGTSADMAKTMFGLAVSLKVFLGRFDMRTMQAATSAVPPGMGREPPADGDGYTYEHLASRTEVWVDFMADTGDGGNPTYAVARSLAAPQLPVNTPAHLSDLAERLSARPAPDDDFASVGGDSPTGSVASSAITGTSYDSAASLPGAAVLPRADLLVLGGDLAYPHPCNETYERRLFSPFEAALPPPSHVHPGRLVVQKPDLPRQARSDTGTASSATSCANTRAEDSAAALAAHDGPTCFAIPGNHDWIDGLETFQRHILHKGWLGAWLLPQEASYFALALPHGWWLFGLDLALVDDIDMCQCRYFARVAEERMGPDDAAILVTHAPRWLTEWYEGEPSGHNLRQLVRGHLRGRARVHLAGDLHFYMRHSFKPQAAAAAAGDAGVAQTHAPVAAPATDGSPGEKSDAKRGHTGSSAGSSPGKAAAGQGSPTKGFVRCPQSFASLNDGFHSASNDGGHLANGSGGRNARVSSPLRPTRVSNGSASSDPSTSSPHTRRSTEKKMRNGHEVSSLTAASLRAFAAADALRAKEQPAAASVASASAATAQTVERAVQLPPTVDPETMDVRGGMKRVVSGESATAFANAPPFVGSSGGSGRSSSESHVTAPTTHTVRFSLTGFDQVETDDAHLDADNLNGHLDDITDSEDVLTTESDADGSGVADDSLLDPEHLICNGCGGAFLHPTHVFAHAHFGPIPARAATAAFVHAQPRGAPGTPASHDSRRSEAGSAASEVPTGEYRCASSYPSPKRSLKLGQQNLHLFRRKNTRFDVIGGLLYYVLVVSLMPRCTGVAEVLGAPSLAEAARHFLRAAAGALAAIFTESYVSLAALLAFFVLLLAFARAGGVGVAPGPPSMQAAKQEPLSASLGLRARHGGLATQLVFTTCHCFVHLATAISLMLILELAVETCIRFEKVGTEGYHSLFHWYRDFEAAAFPDPSGLRARVAAATGGLYPAAVRGAMAVFDVVEAIAVARTSLCTPGSPPLTRIQAVGFYLGMLSFFWVITTPFAGAIFGCYLYVCSNWWHVHYDESFSALRIQHFKGFNRCHINTQGDLEIYGLAMDRVPGDWREDRRWRTPSGGGSQLQPSYKANYPSRWIPFDQGFRDDMGCDGTDSTSVKIVDYLVVKKKRPTAKPQPLNA